MVIGYLLLYVALIAGIVSKNICILLLFVKVFELLFMCWCVGYGTCFSCLKNSLFWQICVSFVCHWICWLPITFEWHVQYFLFSVVQLL